MGQYVEQGYQFDLTAPQINDILLMARNFSRPNLLHNSRFQVNQRGKTFPNTTPTSANDIPQDGVYPLNSVEINGFILDRWHAPSYGVTYNWDGTYGPENASVIKGTADNNVTVFSQHLWTPGARDGNNIIFDKDITISILYKDGNLFTATGHTATRADWQSVANTGNVASDKDIVAMDGDIDVMRFTCRKTSSNSSIMQAAFLLEINQRNSGIVAAKVEIGVGQTLAIKVGNRWELIDQYNYHDDLKICQRFYKSVNIPCSPVVFDKSSNTTLGNGKYVTSILLNDIYEMVFTPSIVCVGRMYICNNAHNAPLTRYDNGICYMDENYAEFRIINGTYSHYGIGMANKRSILVIILSDSTSANMGFTTGVQHIVTIVDGIAGNDGQAYGCSAIALSAEI